MEDFQVRKSMRLFYQNWRILNSKDVCSMSEKKTTKEKRDPIGYKGKLRERLKKEGKNTHDAIMEGGKTRLRPILMTAITTMVAMVPIALGLGEGTVMAAELAVVVIGGLFSSTLLTLLVIPVIYSLAEGIRSRLRKD